MKEIIVEIKNDQGVHARPSGQIVNIAKKYDVALEIEKVFENEQAENNKEENEKIDKEIKIFIENLEKYVNEIRMIMKRGR